MKFLHWRTVEEWHKLSTQLRIIDLILPTASKDITAYVSMKLIFNIIE